MRTQENLRVSDEVRETCVGLMNGAEAMVLGRMSVEECLEQALTGLKSEDAIVQRTALQSVKRALGIHRGKQVDFISEPLVLALLGVALGDGAEANKIDARECLLFSLREMPEHVPTVLEASVLLREAKREKVQQRNLPAKYIPLEMCSMDESIQRLWIAVMAEDQKAVQVFTEKQADLMADMLEVEPAWGLQWRALWFFKRLSEKNPEAVGTKACLSLERAWGAMKEDEPTQAAMVGEVLKALRPCRTLDASRAVKNSDGLKL